MKMPVDWSDLGWRRHFRIRFNGFRRGLLDWRLWMWVAPMLLIPLPFYFVPALVAQWRQHPGWMVASILALLGMWLVLAWRPVRALQDQYDGWALRQAGHCPHCGYDRRGDFTEPCPECGGNGEESGAKPAP